MEQFPTFFVGLRERGAVLAHNGLEGNCAVTKSAQVEEAAASGKPGDIHRIGGGTVENLRLKPAEAVLEPPGISVLKAPTPDARRGGNADAGCLPEG